MKHWRKMNAYVVAACLLLMTVTQVGLADGDAAKNLLPQGDFESEVEVTNDMSLGEDAGKFKLFSAAKLVKDDAGNHVLRLTKTEGRLARAQAWLKVDPSWKTLEVSARMRAKDVKKGEKGWQVPRMLVYFQDAENTRKMYVASPELTGDTEWVTKTVRIAVPEGAAIMRIEPGVYGPSGVLDVDDIRIVANPGFPYTKYVDGFPFGTFEQVDGAGDLLGWGKLSNKVSRLPHDPDVEKSGHFVRLSTDNPKQTPQQVIVLNIPEKWMSFKLAVRMRATDLKIGSESWHNPRVQVMFMNEDGEHVGGWPGVPTLSGNEPEGWQEKSVDFNIPAGAKYMRLTLAMYGCTGTVDFDDITFDPKVKGQLPEGHALHWDQVPVKALSETRGEIVLNGLWRFVPAVGSSESKPNPDQWGYIRVPGSWSRYGIFPGVVLNGTGDAWDIEDMRQLTKGWYEREVTIPAAWQGRAVFLKYNGSVRMPIFM